MNIHKRILAWTLVFVEASFPIWLQFNTAMSYARAAEISAEKQALMNESALSTANSIYNFNLPSVNTSSDSSYDEYYTDSTGKYLKNETHLKDIVANYNTGESGSLSFSDYEAELSANQGYAADTATINEALTNGGYQDTSATLDCSALSGSALTQCEAKNNRKELLDAVSNGSRSGAIVTYSTDVLEASTDYMDGNNEYIDDILGDDACVTVTEEGEEGEPVYVTEEKYCTRQYASPVQECPLARDQESAYRSTRTLYSIPSQVGALTEATAKFSVCGSGCNLMWLGKSEDSTWRGSCSIFEEVNKLRIIDPTAISSAAITRIEWDDYIQIYFDSLMVWTGPASKHGAFPPEKPTYTLHGETYSAGCELKKSWKENTNVNVTNSFKSKSPGDILTAKMRVEVTGTGEGFYKTKILWNANNLSWDTCRNNAPYLKKPFRNYCVNFLAQFTSSMCSWAASGADSASLSSYNNLINSGHSCENWFGGYMTTYLAQTNGDYPPAMDNGLDPKVLNACVWMLDKENVPTTAAGQLSNIMSMATLPYDLRVIATRYYALSVNKTRMECTPIVPANIGAPGVMSGEQILTLPVFKEDSSEINKTVTKTAFGLRSPITTTGFHESNYEVGNYMPWNIRVKSDGFVDFTVLDWGAPSSNWNIKLKLNLKYATYADVYVDLRSRETATFRPAQTCNVCTPVSVNYSGQTYTMQGRMTNGTCSYGFQPDNKGACPAGWTMDLDKFCHRNYATSCSGSDTNPKFDRSKCNVAYEKFLNGDANGTLECVDYVTSFKDRGGVVYDENNPGFYELLGDWKQGIAQNDLPDSCYKAVLKIDTSDQEYDTYECRGLTGDDYTNCMLDTSCVDGEIPETGETCYVNGSSTIDYGTPLTESDPYCGELVADASCTLDESATTCVQTISDASWDGSAYCIAEDYKFNCVTQTGTLPASADTTTLTCNTDLMCLGEECVSLEEEENEQFTEAAVALKYANEVRAGMECTDTEDLSTCFIFGGNMRKCNTYRALGLAPDCCDADELGLQESDWVLKYKAAMMTYELAVHDYTQKWIFSNWTGVSSYSELFDQSWAGSTYQWAVNGVNTYLYEPVASAYNGFVTSHGMTWAEIPSSVGTDAASSGAVVGAAPESVFGNGAMQYVAKGVYKLLEMCSQGLGDSIFTTATTEAGTTSVTGFQNQALNSLASNIGTAISVIGWIYLAWQLTNIVIALLYHCGDSDYEAVQDRENQNCLYVGRKCTAKTFWGDCTTYTSTYCCYDSLFARVLMKQAAIQLGARVGENWKDYTLNRGCAGLALDQLTTLDFDVMDFSEFTSYLMSAGVLAYDPNSMPDDYYPTDKYSTNDGYDGITTTEAQTTVLEDAISGIDESHQSNSTDVTINDDGEMMWYDGGEASSQICEYDCSSGDGTYNSTTGLCEVTVTTPTLGTTNPTYGCSESDFEYDAEIDECVGTVQEEPQGPCKVGYIYAGSGYCVYYNASVEDEPDVSCSEGYVLNENETACIATETVDKVLACNTEGYTLVDDQCVLNSVTSVAITKTCSTGYTVSSDGTSCVMPVTMEPESDGSCLLGVYNETTNLCESSQTEDVDLSCPSSSYIYDSVTGLCTETIYNAYDAGLVCPSGYTSASNTTCVRNIATATPTYSCDELNAELYAKIDNQEVHNGIVEPLILASSPTYSAASSHWTLYGQNCNRSYMYRETQGYYCENSDLTYNSETGVCEYADYGTAYRTCPYGYILTRIPHRTTWDGRTIYTYMCQGITTVTTETYAPTFICPD
jgi:hypothetical protein